MAEAGDAAEARRQVATFQPQVVLADVGMKDVNGIEMTAQLLAEQPGLKVLMLSMYDNPEYVQRALQAGAPGLCAQGRTGQRDRRCDRRVAAGGTFLSPEVSRRLFRNQAPKPVLSARESQILTALGRGWSSKQIARELSLSVRTVEAHRQNIKRKLELEGQARADQVRRRARGRTRRLSPLPRADPRDFHYAVLRAQRAL